MEQPDVGKGDWIILRATKDSAAIEARVYKVNDDGSLFVGYHQHSFKTIKARAVWSEDCWLVGNQTAY